MIHNSLQNIFFNEINLIPSVEIIQHKGKRRNAKSINLHLCLDTKETEDQKYALLLNYLFVTIIMSCNFMSLCISIICVDKQTRITL